MSEETKVKKGIPVVKIVIGVLLVVVACILAMNLLSRKKAATEAPVVKEEVVAPATEAVAQAPIVNETEAPATEVK